MAFPAPVAESSGARLSFEALVARLSAAARVLGVEIRLIEVRGPQDFDSFAKSHLPAIGYDRRFAESGGLLAYGPTPLQNAPRLAAQIDKIFKGAKPADLPVEQPTKFDLVINLKTAKALGVTIPQTLLLRADQVIE